MTLQQFQNIAKIDNKDTIEYLGFAMCELFGFTPDQVEAFPKWKQLYYSYRVGRILSNLDYVSIQFITDAKQITLGQFIEVIEWLKSGEVENYHMIAASIYKHKKNHAKDAEAMQQRKAKYVVGAVQAFLKSYAELLQTYEGLFDGDKDESETHPFIANFGWLFTAKSIADYLGIELNKAYELNIIEALNAMVYLKSYNEYLEWQNKQTSTL